MPTVQQLPAAVAVSATDEVMLDQNGVSVAATVAQVFASGVSAITLTGDVTGSGTDTIVTTLAAVGTPGTFTKVSVNAKGQVTGGGAVAAADVVGALGFTPYSASNPAGYAQAASLATVATSGNYGDLAGAPVLGGMAAQNPSTIAVTGGAIAGADLSSAAVTAAGSTQPRTPGNRAADRLNVLDFGADPTGVADSSPAFSAAMATVQAGSWAGLRVPRGTYRLNSFINQPSGHSVSVLFDEGAVLSGGGGLGVDRVESKQGPYSVWQGGGGDFGFSPVVGTPQNYAFHTDIVQNTPGNSGASRIGWSRNYANTNYYGKYTTGIDFAEQNIYSWPHLYDNSSGWGHWEVIAGTLFDEDSAARAHLTASCEHSEFDIVNNGPESGWTYKSGIGNPVQGMSMDPWGQNGLYGGNILYAYGSVGSFDGQGGGVNSRWPSYPAAFSQGNPATVPAGSTIIVTFDTTAKATAALSGGGVSGLNISNGGGLYTSAPSVAFSGGGGGSGAAATAVMLGGAVVGVSMTANGAGYTSAPVVTFTGGGVPTPTTVTVTLNSDGAHGDLASIAGAINTAMTAAGFPLARAAVAQWGGVASRLVVFGTAAADLGTLTLAGTALATLGMAAGAYKTQRDINAVVLGGTGGVAVGDKLIINGTTITVGGAGAQSDVVSAITSANLVGIKSDITAAGRIVVSAYIPQNPGGLVLSQPAGYTTLTKIGLQAGTFWPPTPPKGFATVASEISSPICRTSDQISVSATDLSGNVYGPVTVTLSGGAGTGWVADVAASIQAAVTTAGFYNATSSFNLLSAPPLVLAVGLRGAGGTQGLLIRNTAGGTISLANVTGTPLQTLGIASGTFQPGGGTAGSQSVFMAAPDSIAPQGRGIFLGGSNTATDRTVWPHAPLEARGNFLHGLRTDKATFDDNLAVLVGATQAIGFGSGAGSVALTAASGALQVNGTSIVVANALPAGAGTLLGATGTAGAAGTVAIGANLALSGGTLSATGVGSFNGRSGTVTLASADVTGALGYTPGSGTGTVSSVVAGTGLAGGTISVSGTVSLAGIAAGSLMGNAGTLSAVPGAITVGSGIALSAGGTLSNAGVLTFNTRGGAVSLTGGDVTGALSYTPLSNAGGTLSGALTLNGGATLAGTLTNGGTISGGVISGPTLAGTVAISGTATATTQAAADNSTKLATTGFVYQATAGAATVATTGGSTTLVAGQYGVPVIVASGALASNATFVMPTTGTWMIANRTTGAFTLTVKTATGTGVVIDQGFSQQLVADGTNVVVAVSDFNGVTLQGIVTNAGTITGGTLAGAVAIASTATAATQAAGDNSTKLATTGYVYLATAGVGTVATTGGSTTLTSAQYAVPVILVTGALTSNATLVMPNTGIWMIANRTTGAFTLTVKTAAGTGVGIDQGYSLEVIADGTNVVVGGSDFNGITLQGTVTNAGTIAGGSLGGTVTAAGTLNVTGTATATTQAVADNSTKLATTGFVYQATAGTVTIATVAGTTTLTPAQYGVPVILATGALTGNATFVVPNTGMWMIANRTTGAFTLTVKTASGTGVAIDQGYSQELVADGTNVVVSISDFNGVTLQGTVTNAGTLSGGMLAPVTLVAGSAGSTVTMSQTVDAGGYHPVVMRGGGTNVNVPLVLAPGGSGYIAAALSDGTATNGNQRGQYAVDLSQSRAANTQVASGAYAAIPGGANITAGGSYSLAAGQGSTATGQGSVALGQFANDGGAYGKLVFSGNAATVGNQFGLSTLFVSSVAAAARMTSDGAAAGAANSLPIRSNHVIAGTLTVAARNVSNGDGASWSIPVLFKNSAGTVSVTSPGTAGIAPTVADSTLSTASIAIAADNTNKGLSVTITPPASVTVNASAVLMAVEM